MVLLAKTLVPKYSQWRFESLRETIYIEVCDGYSFSYLVGFLLRSESLGPTFQS